MVSYRSFRNTDPPALVRIWNEVFTGRGAVHLHHASALEQQVFSRLYFDPKGLIIAETSENEIIGFAHAGFTPDINEEALSKKTGVICMIGVLPQSRRDGVATELLQRCENYLSERGAEVILAGQRPPHDPFYHGLYGGTELPGFLVSDPLVEPFLIQNGYQIHEETVVFQREVQEPLRIFDPRFVSFRQRFEISADIASARPTWWQNCTLGTLEPLEFSVIEKSTGHSVAQTLIIDLAGFSETWRKSSVGIFSLFVHPPFRGHGVAKFLLTQALRFVQEQCFELVEIHGPADSPPARRLCTGLGFSEVDLGRVYIKRS